MTFETLSFSRSYLTLKLIDSLQYRADPPCEPFSLLVVVQKIANVLSNQKYQDSLTLENYKIQQMKYLYTEYFDVLM